MKSPISWPQSKDLAYERLRVALGAQEFGLARSLVEGLGRRLREMDPASMHTRFLVLQMQHVGELVPGFRHS